MNALKGLSDGIARQTTLKRVILFALVFVAILAVMEASPIGTGALKAASGGQGMLDMRFAYSSDTVRRMFDALGANGSLLYERLLALDVIFAFAFMAFQALAMSALIRRAAAPAPLMRLNLLPSLRCALDLIENALLMTMLAPYPSAASSGRAGILAIAPVASAVTSAKWIVYYAIIALFFIFGALAVMRPKERKR